MRPPTAVVINMHYAGLGVARSLSAQGIPVVGLSAYRTSPGMFTRRAKTVSCPDSRDNPERLVEFLMRLATTLSGRSVLFPSCDHDLIFIDRYREQLEPYYALAIANRPALRACLDKWQTYALAVEAGVPVPRTWVVTRPEDVERILPDVIFPCVLKPIASYYWKKHGDWELLGGRKACQASSPEELRKEYAFAARADRRALIQQLIPGGEDSLVVAACYLDRDSNWVSGFNTQKLAQFPPGFGSGSIVQTLDLPELFEPTIRLLQKMRFTGIAAVEYKWDQATGQYMLIEVNARVWDQYRLGPSCDVDLAYLAYQELAGLTLPRVRRQAAARKWIAEDRFLNTLIKLLWSGEPGARDLFRLARGKRVYAICDWKDPLPAIAYFMLQFFPDLARSALRRLWFAVRRMMASNKPGCEAPCEE